MVLNRPKLLVWSNPGEEEDHEEPSDLLRGGDSPFDEPPLAKTHELVAIAVEEDNADTHDGRLGNRFQQLRHLQKAVEFSQQQHHDADERVDEDDENNHDAGNKNSNGVPHVIPGTPPKKSKRFYQSKFPRRDKLDTPNRNFLDLGRTSTFETASTACSEDSEDYHSYSKDLLTGEGADMLMRDTPPRCNGIADDDVDDEDVDIACTNMCIVFGIDPESWYNSSDKRRYSSKRRPDKKSSSTEDGQPTDLFSEVGILCNEKVCVSEYITLPRTRACFDVADEACQDSIVEKEKREQVPTAASDDDTETLEDATADLHTVFGLRGLQSRFSSVMGTLVCDGSDGDNADSD